MEESFNLFSARGVEWWMGGGGVGEYCLGAAECEFHISLPVLRRSIPRISSPFFFDINSVYPFNNSKYDVGVT